MTWAAEPSDIFGSVVVNVVSLCVRGSAHLTPTPRKVALPYRLRDDLPCSLFPWVSSIEELTKDRLAVPAQRIPPVAPRAVRRKRLWHFHEPAVTTGFSGQPVRRARTARQTACCPVELVPASKVGPRRVNRLAAPGATKLDRLRDSALLPVNDNLVGAARPPLYIERRCVARKCY